MPPSFLIEQPTRFELFLGKLGIEEAGCEHYPLVRNWIEKHKNVCYIPEDLLKKCHLQVELKESELWR